MKYYYNVSTRIAANALWKWHCVRERQLWWALEQTRRIHIRAHFLCGRECWKFPSTAWAASRCFCCMTFPTGGNEFLKLRLIAPTPSLARFGEAAKLWLAEKRFSPTESIFFRSLAGNAAALNDDIYFHLYIVFFVRFAEMRESERLYLSEIRSREATQHFVNKHRGECI